VVGLATFLVATSGLRVLVVLSQLYPLLAIRLLVLRPVLGLTLPTTITLVETCAA
jgi:hypothetical protein